LAPTILATQEGGGSERNSKQKKGLDYEDQE
jgi:hypothetical protein